MTKTNSSTRSTMSTMGIPVGGSRLSIGNTIRKANSTFFDNSGIRSNKNSTQRPYIAIRTKDGVTSVNVYDDITEVINLPRRTRILAQWVGKSRSDYYSFSVEQLREHCTANSPTGSMMV